jgi:hypothetical protein
VRGGQRLAVELPRLRQVRGALVEVLRGEEAAALADGRRQDGRVRPDEVALVEEVVDRLLDLVADAQDRHLPRAAQPEVPVVEEEVDAVLLRLDGIVRRTGAEDLD